MSRLTRASILFLAALHLQGAPSINTPVVSPPSLTVNQATIVTVSCQINAAASDPVLIQNGVNLVRLTSAGVALSTLGVMHDDGLNGDTKAGDGIFTLQSTFNETAVGQFQLQCTAAFKGLLQRVKSPAVTVNVASGSGTLTITLPSLSPATVALGVPTTVATTAKVTGGTPDPSSVMLQRLDSAGRVLAILGTLTDGGNGTFSIQTTFIEFAVGPISLRVAATFSGAVSHVFSPVATLTVTGTPPPTVTITAPTNLSYLSLSPTTVNGTVSDPTATVVINSIQASVGNGHFSASIPLAEGPNILTATATSASGAVGTASLQVNLDTTPPHVTITSPTDQFVTTDASVSVAGNVNDIVVGTVNSQQAQVKVNGTPSQVANRTFLATNVPLVMGNNTIQAVAVDQAGNSATTQVSVIRQPPQPGQIRLVSGNNQTGTIGTGLGAPLVITLVDSSGNPAANQTVIFSVAQNNGMLTVGSGTPAANVMATTNAQGQASAVWTLGMRAGAGSDAVQAYSVGFQGTAVFTASATQGKPGLIVIDSGNNQTAAVNQQLPKPLIAVIVDAGHNRLVGVPLTFTVVAGGGSIGGQASVTLNTDSDGRVAVTPTLGFQEGNSNNLITANFAGNIGFPASFTASGLGPGDPAKTVISGLVLDNSNQPVPGVTVRALLTNVLTASMVAAQTAPTAQTDATGHFSLYKVPVGYVKLLVDGSTATATDTFPSLEYDMVTVAGQINTVNQPIYLLPIKTNNKLCVDATTGGGTLTIPEAPGFSLTFGPGQVTFPGGTKTGCVSVSVVHPDKVPMVPGFGQQPRFIVTIQPSGALFNPPAPITLPNVDGLAPREVTEMYSFDHDIGSFVAIGTGTVSDDGQVIRSNVGVGVLKAGWHCGGNSNQPGTAATCPICSFCQGTTCTPQGNGTPCGNGGACQFTGPGQLPQCNCPPGQVLNPATNTCVSNRPCPPGYSLVNGQCCQGPTCRGPQCPPGTVLDPTTGTCVSLCPPGYTLVNNQCCQGNSCTPPQCPPGQTFDPVTGTCVNSGPCPTGYTLQNGQCCQGTTCIPPSCPSGQNFDPVSGTCVNSGPCPTGCSACVTIGGIQQCTQCSNGQPPVNGQCGGQCTVKVTQIVTPSMSDAVNPSAGPSFVANSPLPGDFIDFTGSASAACTMTPQWQAVGLNPFVSGNLFPASSSGLTYSAWPNPPGPTFPLLDGELVRSGPLSYQVTISIGPVQDVVNVTQDSIDQVRQQYIDTAKNEKPPRSSFTNSVPAGSTISFAQIKSPDADWAIFTILDQVELLQQLYGRPLTITSGYRTPARNGSLPGSTKNSAHIYGNAVDINTFGDVSLWDTLRGIVNSTGGCVEANRDNPDHIHAEWGNALCVVE